jgi:hypothetical protein
MRCFGDSSPDSAEELWVPVVPEWKEGHLPNLGDVVAVIDDSEFVCSAVVKPEKLKANALKRTIRDYFEIRLFSEDLTLPCTLWIYEKGALVTKKNFLVSHRKGRTNQIWSFLPTDWRAARRHFERGLQRGIAGR